MPKVQFVVEHLTVEVQSGRCVRDIALEAGVYPNREWFRGWNCGGRGLCGTCKVWVKQKAADATSAPNLREKFHGMGDGRRLACQTRVQGDIEVVTFPGGDDRTIPGRRIDPPPIRPEAAEQAAKAGGPPSKPDAAPKAEKPKAGVAGASEPKPDATKKADAAAAEGKATEEAKPRAAAKAEVVGAEADAVKTEDKPGKDSGSKPEATA
jgi:ferredoxin